MAGVSGCATNILVDRHHAGLYNSLQLLFEDRLGHTLYTPIGHEWWDEGYWRFGQVFGDDRLAQQYLMAADFDLSGMRFTYSDELRAETNPWLQRWLLHSQARTYDPEFPDRPIYGVTLERARKMPWFATLATVQENQQGFYRFAEEHGAKFLYGVGNTNQQIDWTLDPLVLNSSEMPLLGRGVQIGQEFDSDGLFAFWPPQERHVVRSFVNCMPEICVDHPELGTALETMRMQPDFRFSIHGISGPQGNIKPISDTAELMRCSGWGWHDKPQGDGFGHVIHYWAAIGRPLIGHGSFYNGKNASVFWRDLETCIDFDKHPIEEAIALIREISADPPRHEAMCRAIRRVFDETTDWAGDAEKVRELIA